MYYTYVLKSERDGRLYIGFSNNLKKRYVEHTIGEVPATEFRRPFSLIYYEACLNKEDALRRERYLKSGVGKRYLKNRLRSYLV